MADTGPLMMTTSNAWARPINNRRLISQQLHLRGRLTSQSDETRPLNNPVDSDKKLLYSRAQHKELRYEHKYTNKSKKQQNNNIREYNV